MTAAGLVVTDLSHRVGRCRGASRWGFARARREVRLVDIVEYVQGALHHTMHGPGTGEN